MPTVIRRAGAKSPAKKPAPKKTTKSPAAKPAAKKPSGSRGENINPDMRKKLRSVGKRRAKAVQEHKDSVDAVAEIVREARAAGVSMADIADEMGIVRQWLYKIPEMNKRTGVENKPAGRKPSVERKTSEQKKKSAAPRAKRAATRTVRSTGTRVKITRNK